MSKTKIYALIAISSSAGFIKPTSASECCSKTEKQVTVENSCPCEDSCNCGDNCNCGDHCACKRLDSTESKAEEATENSCCSSKTASVDKNNFVDVNENHWAYQALNSMHEKGIIEGFPNHTFQGSKLLSRYQFAEAIYNAWKSINNELKVINIRIKGINEVLNSDENNKLFSELKEAISKLAEEGKNIKTTLEDVENLKKLVDTFKSDLEKLNCDVKQAKETKNGLEFRIGKIEDNLNIKFSGDLSTLAITSFSSENEITNEQIKAIPGISELLKFAVVGNGGKVGTKKELLPNSQFFYELGVNISGDLGNNIDWKSSTVYGNAIGENGLGFYSGKTPGSEFQMQKDTIYIPEFHIGGKTEVSGVNLGLRVGRQTHEVSDMILKRGNSNSTLFNNERWNETGYTYDGFKGSAELEKFGKVTLFGGTTGNNTIYGVADTADNKNSNVSDNHNPLTMKIPEGEFSTPEGTRNFKANRFYGAHAESNLGGFGKANLAYVLLNTGAKDIKTEDDITNISVVGGDAMVFVHPNFGFQGGYSMNYYSSSEKNVEKKDASAYFGHAIYYSQKIAARAGYRNVGPNYYAPGTWGTSSLIPALSNTKGFYGEGRFHFCDKFSVGASGEYLTSVNDMYKDRALMLSGVETNYKHSDMLEINASVNYGNYSIPKAENKTYLLIGTAYADIKCAKNTNLRVGYQHSHINEPAGLADLGLVMDSPYGKMGLPVKTLCGGMPFINFSLKF